MRQHLEEARVVLRELSDLRCQQSLAPRLSLWVNLSLLGWVSYGLTWLVVWSFQRAVWLGLVHLALVPLALLATVVLARTLLELTLAVLQIRDHVVEFGELPRRIGSWPALQRLAGLGERRVWRVTRVEETTETR